MFLFCVTRDSVAGRIPLPTVREFPAGDWRLTAATDDWLASVSHHDGRIVLTEAAPYAPPAADNDAGGDEGLVFVTATYRGADGSIEVFKSLIGGRQVYYHVGADGSFYCASHARLLRAAGVRLEDDPGRMAELFVYRYVSAPNTLFKDVHQLLAGQRLRFERTAAGALRVARSEQYQPPPAAPPRHPKRSTDQYGPYGDRTRDALSAAMRALLPAKGRLHLLASGGLDSSILFKMARDDLDVTESHSTSYPFETEADDVEKRYALTAAEAMGARHQFFVPTTRQFLRGFFEAVSIAEEPLVHTQSVLMLLMLRDGLPAGDGTVVVGQGADGAFGLRMHQTVEKVDRFRRNRPRLARVLHPSLFAAFRPLLSVDFISRHLRRGISRLGRDQGVIDVLHRRWGNGTPPADPRHVLWSVGATSSDRWARRRFGAAREQVVASRAAAIAPYADRPVLDAISLLDFLSDVSTTQSIWSKFGEAARKVVYYPFNARPLLDAAFQTPWEVKLAEPKGVLRDVARKIGVPEFVITRPKANFNIDPTRWAVRGAVFESLVPLAAKVFGEREVRRVQRPNFRRGYIFWNMLNYAVWKRLVVDGETIPALLADVQERMPAGGVSEDDTVLAGGH